MYIQYSNSVFHYKKGNNVPNEVDDPVKMVSRFPGRTLTVPPDFLMFTIKCKKNQTH